MLVECSGTQRGALTEILSVQRELRKSSAQARSSSREDHILQWLAVDEAVDVVCPLAPTPRHHPPGPTRTMWCHQDVRQLVEGMTRWPALRFGRIRVLPPHIQRRSANPAISQRGVNGILIDWRAARDFDEERRALYHRQATRIDQPFCFRSECPAQHDEITSREHLVEF